MVQKEAPTETNAAVFHVRARIRQDLENLLKETGLPSDIQEWPGADYRYRIIVTQPEIDAILSALAGSLDYANFKSKIAATPNQREKLHAYHEVWHTMAHLQR